MVVKRAKRNPTIYTDKNPSEKKNFIKDVFAFRLLKKSMVGKSRAESLDFLDPWIVKKKTLTFFF